MIMIVITVMIMMITKDSKDLQKEGFVAASFLSGNWLNSHSDHHDHDHDDHKNDQHHHHDDHHVDDHDDHDRNNDQDNSAPNRIRLFVYVDLTASPGRFGPSKNTIYQISA